MNAKCNKRLYPQSWNICKDGLYVCSKTVFYRGITIYVSIRDYVTTSVWS